MGIQLLELFVSGACRPGSLITVSTRSSRKRRLFLLGTLCRQTSLPLCLSLLQSSSWEEDLFCQKVCAGKCLFQSFFPKGSYATG